MGILCAYASPFSTSNQLQLQQRCKPLNAIIDDLIAKIMQIVMCKMMMNYVRCREFSTKLHMFEHQTLKYLFHKVVSK